ncbi:MAG TPA: amidohydrolase family protein [Anaerolineae bacterium]
MRIDAHQHYWKIERTDYGWLQPSSGLLYADFMPEHLRPHLNRYEIDKSVVVQAAPSVAETEFLLNIASHEETIAGVVGWLDLEAADLQQQWERLHRNPKFVGIRPMIQDLPSDWILQPRVIDNLKFLAESGFSVDLQSNPRHLPHLVRLMKLVPNLRAVIDHLATPSYNDGLLEPWAGNMMELASYPTVMCKLSGMVYGKDRPGWSPQAVRPFAEHVITAFGRQRVMFGTDWPVCLRYATFDEVMSLMESMLDSGWSTNERANVYGMNAARFYGLT